MRQSFRWLGIFVFALTLSTPLFGQTVASRKTGESAKGLASSPAQDPGDNSTPSGGPRSSPPQETPRFSPARELNDHLPKWLSFDGEYRARLEQGLTGKLFYANTADTYFLNRVRLGVTVRPSPWLKFHAEGQDARAFDKNPPRTSGFYDLFDLRQAYMEVGDTEKGTLALRAGRQVFYWGEGRLVAESLWSFPGARSFDAVRLTLRHGGYRLDSFAASATQINPAVNTGFTAPSFGNNIHGLYGGIEKLVPKAIVEPYVFWRIGALVTGEDKKKGDLNFKTYGFRWVGKLPARFDYGTEVAVQRGKVADSDFQAWAGHWVLGHTWNAHSKPRFFAEYNYATGDNNAKDGTVQTFDVMYPSTHLKWGETDQVGWRNIHDVRGGFEIVPKRNWTASTNYHAYWLANVHDGLYTANGSVAIPRVSAGTAGHWVGQEADVQGSHKFHSGLEVGAGVGHIFPGTFIRLAASDHGYTYPYIMTIYTF
jgi:Alginate export